MKNKNIIIRVSKIEYDNYRKIATLLNITLSELIRKAIIEYSKREVLDEHI